MIKLDYTKLSKSISHALRHEPWLYELELDDQGWVSIADLLLTLRSQQPEWTDLNKADIAHMIKISGKQRHEIDGDRIRALYGHSVQGKLMKKKDEPPEQLFHGTSLSMVSRIMKAGLLPMGRQYVHLSTDIDGAMQVGKRKDNSPRDSYGGGTKCGYSGHAEQRNAVCPALRHTAADR